MLILVRAGVDDGDIAARADQIGLRPMQGKGAGIIREHARDQRFKLYRGADGRGGLVLGSHEGDMESRAYSVDP
ncbi:hypothetical protein GCM10010990_05640 [Croceicoccus mobilis]|uniref:Uncharacterized protein n=1 Tax=Croceicoccus mobilis TaxID=1703339 RepID=A0A917DPQ7_9SPHN|nr:hypothetical protein GCM10010990_05640 [Croceicoccus mobilis]